jgi:CcmD family protein
MSYLLAAYSMVFILLFLYVISMSSKQKRLESELETLRKLLERKK